MDQNRHGRLLLVNLFQAGQHEAGELVPAGRRRIQHLLLGEGLVQIGADVGRCCSDDCASLI